MVKKDKPNQAANKADKRNTNTTDKQQRNHNKQHNKHNKHSTQPAAYTDFTTQLASLHLRLQHIDGDGNCLFRSIADQVEGVESNHAHYRQLACAHIAERSELYAPFIDGGEGGKAGEGLKGYVARMGRLGEWGGNLELVALARALQRDIVVHQLGAPRLLIDGEVKARSNGSRSGALHLAYHSQEHYSSVRRADDHSIHSEPLPIMLPASNTAFSHQQPSSTAPTSDERRVMAATGLDDVERVRAVLRDMAGDVDSAIEVVVAEQDAQLQAEKQPPPTEEKVAAEEVKEVKVTSKAKLSTKELKKVLKAERADKKVQRAMERKLERIKEKQQVEDGEKGSSGRQADDGAEEGVVQDFGTLSI